MCRFPWSESILDFSLDVFDHDNGIVDHNAGGKDESEECQGVDRESQEQQCGQGCKASF